MVAEYQNVGKNTSKNCDTTKEEARMSAEQK